MQNKTMEFEISERSNKLKDSSRFFKKLVKDESIQNEKLLKEISFYCLKAHNLAELVLKLNS